MSVDKATVGVMADALLAVARSQRKLPAFAHHEKQRWSGREVGMVAAAMLFWIGVASGIAMAVDAGTRGTLLIVEMTWPVGIGIGILAVRLRRIF